MFKKIPKMNKKIFYLVLSVLSLGMFTACNDNEAAYYTEAYMSAVSFSSQYVTKQPVITGTDVKFNITYHTPDEVLKELVPSIQLPSGATVDPVSGSKVDFTSGSAVFVVTSGNKFYNKSYKVSWVRDPNPDAMITEMTFASPQVVSQPVFDGVNITFEYDFYTTDEELKELIPTIAISPQATVTPASGSKVDFSGGPVEFTVIAGNKVDKTVYTVTALREPSPEASLMEISMAGDAVLTQPVIEGSNITFYVDPTDANALKEIIPTVKISDNATIDPASGSKVDFTSGTVVFTVTAQDGETTAPYNVIAKKATVDSYDMETWTEGNPTSTAGFYYHPKIGGWSSSNAGAFLIKNIYGLTDRVVVTQSNDAHSGSSAARIETLDTQGKAGFPPLIPNIPKVTTGTLFLGEFITNVSNTLNSTKFGIPFTKKPIAVRGYYKYTPGNVFYRATGASDCHKAKEEPSTVDKCALNVIMYEYTTDLKENPTTAEKNAYYAQFRTGENAYNEADITAIARIQDGAQSVYIPFELKLEYKKEYDPTKKYLFSIIFASSYEGDTFSGAPESVLMVDDVRVLSE